MASQVASRLTRRLWEIAVLGIAAGTLGALIANRAA
jgi:hypothetical protein